jgi:hypothetical protein
MWSEAELLKEMTEAADEFRKMIEQPEATPAGGDECRLLAG